MAASSSPFAPGRAARARQHRARQDLYNWMNARCGLVNKANPSRCTKKAVGYVRLGVVYPERLVFNTDYVLHRIADQAGCGERAIGDYGVLAHLKPRSL